MSGVTGGNAHRIGQLAFLQAVAEGGGVPVTGVRDDQGDVDASRPGLIDHVQGQLPLLHMPYPVGDAAAPAAGDLVRIRLRGGRVPWLSGAARRHSVVDRHQMQGASAPLAGLPISLTSRSQGNGTVTRLRLLPWLEEPVPCRKVL